MSQIFRSITKKRHSLNEKKENIYVISFYNYRVHKKILFNYLNGNLDFFLKIYFLNLITCFGFKLKCFEIPIKKNSNTFDA